MGFKLGFSGGFADTEVLEPPVAGGPPEFTPVSPMLPKRKPSKPLVRQGRCELRLKVKSKVLAGVGSGSSRLDMVVEASDPRGDENDARAMVALFLIEQGAPGRVMARAGGEQYTRWDLDDLLGDWGRTDGPQ